MNKFQFTTKHLEHLQISLNPETRVMVFEGTTRSSKSFLLTNIVFQAIKRSPDYLHCLSAKDNDAINDIFLDSDYGLLKAFHNLTLARDKIGGYFLRMDCGISQNIRYKKILLAPHGNAAKWKKILGKGIGVFAVTEINIADMEFVQEIPSRQESTKRPLLIADLNGDAPDAEIYSKLVNYCNILGVIPKETKELMEDFQKKNGTKKGWYYSHWTREDNPIFTTEMIQQSLAQYVPGSFRYYSKGLGLRVAPEGSIFGTALTPLKNPELLWKLEYFEGNQYISLNHKVRRVFFGLDYDKDIKIITITAELFDGKIVILDFLAVEGNVDIEELDKQFKKFTSPYLHEFEGRFKYGYVDHNEFTTTKSLKKLNRNFRFFDANKNNDYGIESRVDNLLILFQNGMILFTEKSVLLIDHFSRLVYDKSGRKWDKNNPSSKSATHYIDSFFYSLCRIWLRLVVK